MDDFKKLLKRFQTLLISEHFFTGLLFFIITVEIMILCSYFFPLELSRKLVFFGFFLGIVFFIAEFILNLMRFSSRFRVAKFIERNNPELKDYVTTTLSLGKETQKYYSEDLVKKAIAEAIKTIKERNPLFRTEERTRFLSRLSVLGVVLFLIISAVVPFDSYQRIEYLYTGRIFLKPGSNILLSKYGGKIIEGDDFSFEITPLVNELFELTVLTVSESGERKIYRTFRNVSSKLRINFTNCRDEFSYEIHADSQVHGPFAVDLVKRPAIEEISIFITPPEYTKLKEYHSNSGDIKAVSGSRVLLSVKFNKDIVNSRIPQLNLEGKINKREVQFDFTVNESFTYNITVFDSDGILFESNVYNIEVIPDFAPVVKVTKPGTDLRLKDVNQKIELEIFTEDDYGLVSATLVFFISDYDQKYTVPLKEYTQHTKSDKILFNWPLSVIQLKPEDFISYHIEVIDNANPGNIGVSQTFTISFKKIEEQLEELVDQGEDVVEALEDIKRESSEIQLELNAIMKKYELQNEDKITWSDKKKLEELKKKQEELITDAQKLQEELKKTQSELDFDSEQLQDVEERMDKVKELLDQVMDEKMKEILNKLNDMLNNENQQNLRKNNEAIKQDSKKLQEMLDRLIKELERLKLEKKIEELVTKTDELIKKEEEINKGIGTEENLDIKQEEVTKGIEELEKELNEQIAKMKETKSEESKELEKTEANADFKGMKESSEELEKDLKEKNNTKSKKGTESLKKDLERLRKNLRKNLDDLKMKGQEGQIDLINLLIRDGIENSRYLKQLNDVIDENRFQIGKSSGNMKDDILNSSDILVRQLHRYSEMLLELGKLTIMLDDKLTERISAAIKSLETSAGIISAGEVNSGISFNVQAYRNINLTILELMKLKMDIQACSDCDSTSMEQMMKMLEKLSQQQGDLNEFLKELAEKMKGRVPEKSELEMFEQMTKEQESIRKALEELNKKLKELDGQQKLLGDLDQTAEDMKDVEKNIKELDIGVETQKKQQKILQRMLDAQKSINKQDYEKKRKAELDKQKMKELQQSQEPNFIEQDMFLDFENFWNENYPEFYKEFLKSYFEHLNQ
ncbi:MAG: hypothetical protein PHV06_05180 [bacterium]|nr:hypothetical protein [bacterium]